MRRRLRDKAWWHLRARPKMAWHGIRDRALRSIAWALPDRVVYWTFLRLWIFAKSGRWGNEPAGLPYEAAEALTRWESRYHPERLR